VLVVLLAVFSVYRIATQLPWKLAAVSLGEPMLVGAITGLIIGWLRRGFSIRRNKGERLISALFSSPFWAGTPSQAFFQFVLIGAAGALVAGALSGGVQLDLLVEATRVLGPGGGGSGAVSLAVMLLVCAILGVIIMVVLDPPLAIMLAQFATKGAAGAAAKHIVSVLIDNWDERNWSGDDSTGLRARIFQGAITGVLVGAVLLISHRV